MEKIFSTVSILFKTYTIDLKSMLLWTTASFKFRRIFATNIKKLSSAYSSKTKSNIA